MKIFTARSSDAPVDGFILDDGNKVLYMSREGEVTKDFKDERGHQVFPPLKAVEPVDPRAVRWGVHMVELVTDALVDAGWHGGLDEDSPLAKALRAVCEREYVPQPDSALPEGSESYDSLDDVPKDVKVIDAGGHVWVWHNDDFMQGYPDWLWSLPKGQSYASRDSNGFRRAPFLEFTGEVRE